MRALALALALLLTVPAAALASDWSAGWAQGEATGRQINQRYSSKSGINTHFSQPLTSSAKPMQPLLKNVYTCPDTGETFEDSGECSSQCPSSCQAGFDAQLQAPSSEAFVEVVVQPGPTGDIATTLIRQDTDFDGSFDFALSVSTPISGVCANGFISCTPGTWDDCRYYVWELDEQGRIASAEVPYITPYLAGCYCINSSCGQNVVWDNIAQILEHLGGGVVGAIQQENPHYTVTRVRVLVPEMTIRFYGQRTPEGVRPSQSGIYASGTEHPEQYYGKSALLASAAEDEVLSQTADPDSFYNLMANTPYLQERQVEVKTCTIKRDYHLDWEEKVIGFDAQFYVGWDSWAGGTSTADCFWARRSGQCMDDWNSHCPDWATCVELNLRNLEHIIHAIYYTGTCIPYTDPASGGTGCFTPPGTLDLYGYEFRQRIDTGLYPPCYGSTDQGDPHELWQVWAYLEDPSPYGRIQAQDTLLFGIRDLPVMDKIDTCSTLDTDGCRLKEEQVCDHEGNCVWTWKNFARTGIEPLPQCKQLLSSVTGLTWTACADGLNFTYRSSGGDSGVFESGQDVWWEVKRTYFCEVSQPYDVDEAKQRAAVIEESTSVEGQLIQYQDLLPATGEYQSGQITVGAVNDYPDCEMVCEVKVPGHHTPAGVQGSAGQYQVNTESFRKVYRACVEETPGLWTCPADASAGEEVIRGCGCLNNFEEAVTVMQLLDEAAKDIICSTTAPN